MIGDECIAHCKVCEVPCTLWMLCLAQWHSCCILQVCVWLQDSCTCKCNMLGRLQVLALVCMSDTVWSGAALLCH